jgi:sigma-B regulation protein RsbU (phosphoserine phosphatase)
VVSVSASMEAVRRLAVAAHRARPEDLPGIAMQLAPPLEAVALIIYLVDYEQTMLMPHTGTNVPPRDSLPIDTTLAGRAFATGQGLDASAGSQHRVWLPLIDGTERLGVVEVVTDIAPHQQQRRDYETVASLLAEVLVSRRFYGDAVERTRRRLPMQLAAEIIWNQLPPLTFATEDVAVSAILEPCYDVGGDAFDYAVNGDVLHLALFDAVGHGIAASALTSLAISAYRNGRRCGLDLSDTYRSIDKWVHALHPDSFVTAVLAELDIVTGEYRKISAGHPGELLLRDGQLVKQLAAPTALPLGLGHLGNPIPHIDMEVLQPGDRLLTYTDGIVEARADTGEFFGVDRLIEFVTRTLAGRLPAPETLRRLVHAILAHQHEQLQDDATAALVEWRPEFTYGSLPR